MNGNSLQQWISKWLIIILCNNELVMNWLCNNELVSDEW